MSVAVIHSFQPQKFEVAAELTYKPNVTIPENDGYFSFHYLSWEFFPLPAY